MNQALDDDAVSNSRTIKSLHLREHLNAAAHWDAEYAFKVSGAKNSHLTNHLPMALVALTRLGADDDRLAAFSQSYVKRLHAAPAMQPWPDGEPWRERLGQPRAWPMYRSLWRAWMAHEGPLAVLEQALPTLMQGTAAATYQGLIRTAYAVSANHADELADALAYWSCRWFDVGAASATPPGSQPAGLGSDAVLAVQRFQSCPVHPTETLPSLASMAATRYAVDADFMALHLVTSAHAMHQLLPLMNDEDRLGATRAYVAAAACAWASIKPLASSTSSAKPTLPRWNTIVSRVVLSDDEHLIKLVDSCRELERAWGGEVWLRAAAKAAACA